jgi:hypothetical protein
VLGKQAPGLVGLAPFGLLLEGLWFQVDALRALIKAHEEGQKDGAAMVYANTWVATILEGDAAARPYVLPTHVEAANNGRTDAFATLEKWGDKAPEIAKQLLAAHGSIPAVKHVLLVELYKRAGFGGIR